MKYKLLPRLVIFFVIVLSIGAAIELAGIYVVVQNAKANIDTVYKETQYNLIDNIYKREMNDLRLLVSDYANWDDMYNNILEFDYDWSADNATAFLLEESSYGLDAVLVVGHRNKYYEYYGTDEVETYILESPFYEGLKESNVVTVAPVLIAGELYILGASPVTTTDQRKYNGYFILARHIGDEYIHSQLNEYLNVEEYLGVNDHYKEHSKVKGTTSEIDISYLIRNQDDDVLKTLKVYFDMTRYHVNYDILLQHTLLITIIVVLLVLGGIVYGSNKVDLLLKTTINQLDRVAKGDYFYQISENKNYELNQVIEHVNAMGVEIGAHINQLHENHLETLGLLVSAIEEKDQYTRGHSERVKDISLILAKEIGIVDLDMLEEAALLHDIGKIGIHEDILTKPGKLTGEEFEIIKTHSEKGERILKSSSKLSAVSKIIRQHHERIDGKGYPDGLKGHNIQIEARIIAVADAFDAMTSKRPYRNEMPFEKGLSILIECSGTQFDEAVVEAFVRKKDIIEKYEQKHEH